MLTVYLYQIPFRVVSSSSVLYTAEPVACLSIWLRASERPSLLMEPLIHHQPCSSPLRPSLHPSIAPARRPCRAAAAAGPATVHTLSHFIFTTLPVQSHCSNGGFRFQCKGQSSLLSFSSSLKAQMLLLHTVKIFSSKSKCKQKPILPKFFRLVHRGLHTLYSSVNSTFPSTASVFLLFMLFKSSFCRVCVNLLSSTLKTYTFLEKSKLDWCDSVV